VCVKALPRWALYQLAAGIASHRLPSALWQMDWVRVFSAKRAFSNQVDAGLSKKFDHMRKYDQPRRSSASTDFIGSISALLNVLERLHDEVESLRPRLRPERQCAAPAPSRPKAGAACERQQIRSFPPEAETI